MRAEIQTKESEGKEDQVSEKPEKRERKQRHATAYHQPNAANAANAVRCLTNSNAKAPTETIARKRVPHEPSCGGTEVIMKCRVSK